MCIKMLFQAACLGSLRQRKRYRVGARYDNPII
jgi:hypothetical protein